MVTQHLAGRAALVTGGSRGIGAAIARRLAHDGAAVAVTYATSPQQAGDLVTEIEAGGGRAVALAADSADASVAADAVDQAAAAFGRLDILVNNAGYCQLTPLEDIKLDDFDRMVAVNVRAGFVAAQRALRHLGHGGRIINVGSIFADRIPVSGGTIYALTKAAVGGFTRALARELAPRGITVNLVQPGTVQTDANPPHGPVAGLLIALTPAGRFAQPEEITGLVSYLAGPDSAFLTGATMNIDGGYCT
ncbi:MAG TPA: SDR family oxidoreductase [Streptosporangiaceae bacterium]|jgi:3-oxoacyl-[acyl-carrier protein] reductase